MALPAGWARGGGRWLVDAASVVVVITDPTASRVTPAFCSCHWSHQRRWNFLHMLENEGERTPNDISLPPFRFSSGASCWPQVTESQITRQPDIYRLVAGSRGYKRTGTEGTETANRETMCSVVHSLDFYNKNKYVWKPALLFTIYCDIGK